MINEGDVFGIYRVICESGKTTKDGHKIYKLKCLICNKTIELPANSFAYKHDYPKVCKHDISNANCIKNKRIRKIFRNMYSRCHITHCKDYRQYGARGITICEQWLCNPKKFEKWSLKNGYSDNLTIDRIDSNGPYAPWNCRWITRNDNSKFRSITNVFIIDGITDSGKGWSKRLNKSANYINRMVKKHGKEFTQRYINGTYNGFIILVPKNPDLFKK